MHGHGCNIGLVVFFSSSHDFYLYEKNTYCTGPMPPTHTPWQILYFSFSDYRYFFIHSLVVLNQGKIKVELQEK